MTDKEIRPDLTTEEFIAGVPKAELHLHIEGSFEPELMFEIAKRNNVKIKYNSIEELKSAYNFSNLQDFLDIYYEGAGVLLKEQDFYDLTCAYLQRVHNDNVTHVEVMFDPQTHTDRGVEFDIVINGIWRALKEYEQKHDISFKLIMSYLRHLSQDSAFETLKAGLKHKDKITAVGLDSSEVGNPPNLFKDVYAQSVEEGFIPITHAGEEGPPEYIWEALDILKIARIDHGNRCLEDEKLVERIVNEQIGLTVCPLSNLELRVVKDLKDHPILTMLEKNIKATVNSDDPAYFGGYMNDNFNAIAKSLSLNNAHIYKLIKNSFEVSFLNESEKAKKIRELDEFCKI